MVWQEVDESILELERDFLTMLQDIESKDSLSKEMLTLQEENSKLSKQIEMLQKESVILDEEFNKEMKLHESLKKNVESLQQYIEEKEMACKNFQNSMEINERDSLRLKKAKDQLQIGKDFTGIRWDYSAPPNLCKGYIVNKNKKTIDVFELDREKHSDEKIQEFLWNLIEKHSTVEWKDIVSLCTAKEVIEDKENKKLN